MLYCRSTISVAADAAKAWALIRDFGSIGKWHPAIAKVDLSTAGGAARRTLHTHDGAAIEEELVAQDDTARSYSYTIVGGPLPVTAYHSTMSVKPVGTGRCLIVWYGHFKAAGAEAEAALDIVDGVYGGGLEHLREMLEA
jgi:hypothetical protein